MKLNKLKYYILFILVFSNVKFAVAQQSWDIIYDVQDKNSPSSSVGIDSEKNYFIGISNYKKVGDLSEGNYAIYKISPEGFFIDSLKIEYNDKIKTFGHRVIRNDTLFLFGTEIDQIENKTSFVTEIYDLNFNLINSNKYNLTDSLQPFDNRDILEINNEFIISGTYNQPQYESSTINGISLYKFNHNGDSVQFSFYGSSFVFPFSSCESYNNEIVIPTWGWGYNNIDSAYGAIGFGFFSSQSNMPPLFTRRIKSFYLHNGVSIKQYPDSNYLVSADHYLFSFNNVGVFKINHNFEILDSIVISSSPVPYPNVTVAQCLDFTDPNAIYFGSTENVQGSTASPFPNHIRITKLDSNLEVIWEKFYGGDANYFCYTVKATEDGGCIILSTRFDFENDPDPNHLGTYILKLGPDGILTGIEESSLQVKEVLVYPNPGRELNIATGFNNYSLTLFDINGKAVYNRRALSRDSKHDLSFLPGGLYIYRVISENGEVLDSGKWVRE